MKITYLLVAISLLSTFGCEDEINNNIEDENTYSSYIKYNESYIELGDTCIYETMMDINRNSAFYCVINSQKGSIDTARVLLMCNGNVIDKTLPEYLNYSTGSSNNCFTNSSYIHVSTEAVNGYFLSGGHVEINQLGELCEMSMDGIYTSGDSIHFNFSGVILSLDEYRDR